jgi:membrane-bound metal-dependent hydrolase YbcI (DUF457 family)
MLYPTHMLGGAVTAGALATAFGASLVPALLAGALGALLPDLDSPQSKGARLLAPTAGLAAAAATPWAWTLEHAAFLGLVVLAGALLPRLLFRWLGHRGALHSVAVHVGLGLGGFAAAGLAGQPRWLLEGIAAATAGAVIGGLLLDACTVRGIPLLWPFRSQAVHLVPPGWRVRTGRRRELVVRVALTALLAIVCAFSRPAGPVRATGETGPARLHGGL